MESSISIPKRKAEKEKKDKTKKKQRTKDEVPHKKLNEDLIEQMDFVGPKSRRSNFSSPDKLEGKYSEVDV